MSQADAPAADWYPDPSGRFQFRYWDGAAWTGHVSTDGSTDWDPPADEAPQDAAAAEQPAHDTQTQAAQTQDAQAQDVASQDDRSQDDSAFQPTPADQSAEPHGATAADEVAQGTPVAQAADEAQAEQVADAQQAQIAADQAAADQAAADQAAQARAEQEQAAAQAQADEEARAAEQAQAAHDEPAQGGTIEEGEPSDTNLVANLRARLDDDVQDWVDEVAAQVEPRLSRITTGWTAQPQAEAAKACAYGLLLGHLAKLHPHMRPELSAVAEAHPSFTTLEDGARLDTLEQIARDPQRTAAWLGPLIGVEDVQGVQQLFD